MSVLAESLAADGLSQQDRDTVKHRVEIFALLTEFEASQDDYYIAKKGELATFLSNRLKELYP
jgi:hypothetical protein